MRASIANVETGVGPSNVAGYFDIDDAGAKEIAREMGRSVTGWRAAATKAGIKDAEIDRMASAFEHTDLENAVKRKTAIANRP